MGDVEDAIWKILRQPSAKLEGATKLEEVAEGFVESLGKGTPRTWQAFLDRVWPAIQHVQVDQSMDANGLLASLARVQLESDEEPPALEAGDGVTWEDGLLVVETEPDDDQAAEARRPRPPRH